MPVHDVEVRARRWFTTHKDITNTRGYYSCDGEFTRRANYSIKWEKYQFSIRKGLIQQYYNGPKQKGNWNLDIVGGLSKRYAIIFQAARDYYYGNRLGLKSPPTNGFLKPQMKLRYEDEEELENGICIWGLHSRNRRGIGGLYLGNWIRIYRVYPTCRPASQESQWLYGTVIHELAHASHWELRRNNWNNGNTDPKVKESWAGGVERELSRLRYSNYQPSYNGNYTGIVEDLIDGISGYDQVSGYVIAQIEGTLAGASTFENWKQNLINNHDNGTESNLDALFDYWD